MSENMELSVKNEHLGEILARVTAVAPTGETDGGEAGENLIGEYALALVLSGHEAGVRLDFSYGTLKELPPAMKQYMQSRLREGFSFRETARELVTCFAAYVFCLAMNEEDCGWQVRVMRSEKITPVPNVGPLWADRLRITAGAETRTDFLFPAMEGGFGTLKDGRGTMVLSVFPTVRDYRAVTGVNLLEYGLSDVVIEVDAER